MDKKRLQVFISSTYTDLIMERQAAVESILESGHIPAGMELFTAGDESQMHVIRQWIDESDVFLLILGGRYGSIEPTSGKSYVHIEYEYALKQNKPYFAVVMDSTQEEKRVEELGLGAIEREHPKEFQDFRGAVTSRAMVKFWSTLLEIKLAIHQTMAEFAKRETLRGWIPGDQSVNAARLADEISRLTKENSELRMKLAQRTRNEEDFDGLSFSELRDLLSARGISGTIERWREVISEISQIVGPEQQPSLLHVLWSERKRLRDGVLDSEIGQLGEPFRRLREIGVVMKDEMVHGDLWKLSGVGRRFVLQMAHRVALSASSGEEQIRAQNPK